MPKRRPLRDRWRLLVNAALCKRVGMLQLKQAWELFLKNGDKDAPLKAIENSTDSPSDDFDYPYLHRICDMEIRGRAYRVVRVADEDESVYINECDTYSEVGGVPYWLNGEQLRRWIRLETGEELNDDYDPESATNWEMFR
jgi:hypothetical protein